MKKFIKSLASRAHAKMREKAKEKKFRSVFSAVVILVVAAWVAVGTVETGKLSLGWWPGGGLTMEQVKAQTEKFIGENLTGGKKAEIKAITDAGDGIYKVIVQIEGAQNTIESYVTKDGNIFFPSANYINGNPGAASQNGGASQARADVPKSAKPNVELFVMSYCPFGTQMEKGIIPALETLGDSVNFQLKFVDYTLHGKKEFDENVRQFCIEKESPKNLIGYLKCFDGENGDKCLAQNSISAAKINECVSATDGKYKLTELYDGESQTRGGNASFPIHESENKAYGVQGSPTLVVNGVRLDSVKRDSASLLKVMCDAFNDKPSACAEKLSGVVPGPGFGNTPAAAAGGGANCN